MKKALLLTAAVFYIYNNAAIADPSENLYNQIKAETNKTIAFYEKLKTCTPVKSSEQAITVLGKRNGQCSFTMGEMQIEGKTYPFKNCLAPMSVVQKYSDEIIVNLKNFSEKGVIRVSGSTNTSILNPYCKQNTDEIIIRR